MAALAREAPGLRCELVEAEPEQALPELTLGGVDLVLADEWQQQPHPRLPSVDRHELHRDTVRVVLPEAHPLARRHPDRVALAALRDATWTVGHAGTPWGHMVEATCREHGGFDPDVRYRTNDAVVSLALVAAGQAVTLLPDMVQADARPGVVVRASPAARSHRTIVAATRRADASGRPCRRCSPPCAPRRSASLQAIAQPLELVGDVRAGCRRARAGARGAGRRARGRRSG